MSNTMNQRLLYERRERIAGRLIKKIAALVDDLNLALDMAGDHGFDLSIYVLPTDVEDQENPQIGVRFCDHSEPYGDDVCWIGMPVPQAD